MKRFLDLIKYYSIIRPSCKSIYGKYLIHTLDSEETIHYIIKNQCSVARFGDGEMGIILSDTDIKFQKSSNNLKDALSEVLFSQHPNLLVCLPPFFSQHSNINISRKAQRYWDFWAYDHLKNLYNLLSQKNVSGQKKWGDTLISRPYIDWKNKKEHADKTFSLLKKIWNNKNILILEGDQTRMGVGNDLFSNAKSIRRILAPATNAFDKRQEIINTVQKHYTGELILMALGPTATVLALDFAKCGIQAIDIGHVDIEYCWYLQNVSSKKIIEGKYTNEVRSGNLDIPPCTDEKYLSEIVDSVITL